MERSRFKSNNHFEAASGSVRTLIWLLVAGVLALAIVLTVSRKPSGAKPVPPEGLATPTRTEAGVPAPIEPAPAPKPVASQPEVPTTTAPRKVASAQPANSSIQYQYAKTEPTALTRQLVANLTQIQVGEGPLTATQAAL